MLSTELIPPVKVPYIQFIENILSYNKDFYSTRIDIVEESDIVIAIVQSCDCQSVLRRMIPRVIWIMGAGRNWNKVCRRAISIAFSILKICVRLMDTYAPDTQHVNIGRFNCFYSNKNTHESVMRDAIISLVREVWVKNWAPKFIWMRTRHTGISIISSRDRPRADCILILNDTLQVLR